MIAVAWAALATETAPPSVADAFDSAIDLAGWPVLIASVLAVVWAICAKARFSRFFDEKLTKARRSVYAGRVRPALAEFLRMGHEEFDWPAQGALSRLRNVEQLTAERISAALGGQAYIFQPYIDAIESNCSKLRDLETFRERWLYHCHRQGFAMAGFVLCWVYGLAWQREFSSSLPDGLSFAIALVAALSLGWFAAEKLGQWSVSNHFSDLKVDADKIVVGDNE